MITDTVSRHQSAELSNLTQQELGNGGRGGEKGQGVREECVGGWGRAGGGGVIKRFMSSSAGFEKTSNGPLSFL